MTAHPVTWFEVHSPAPERAKGFYAELFGWEFSDEAPGYAMVRMGPDAPIGGGIVSNRPGQQPMTVFNVQVPEVRAVCDAVERAGGTVAIPAQETPAGLKFAYLTDPDGSTFGIWTPPPS